MPAKTRSGIASLALKKITSALACAMLLSASVHAAGLGKLTVLSALGQPLKAEIELTALSGDESGSLAIQLAPADAFRLANIEFNPALLTLRFSVEQRASRQYIAVTSSQPVNEPFVDMLLELSWNSGRLVREYTFLLDPPELRQSAPPPLAQPVDLPGLPQPAPVAAPRPAAPEPAAAVASAAPGPARAPERVRPKAATAYRVRPGDTLSQIALRNKPADVSLDQMLAALYRSNPDAFTGKNMNRMLAGKILALPDEASIRAESKGEARSMVTAHAIDFSAYRNKLAGQVALSAPTKGVDAGQSAAGKISAKVEERTTPANTAQDQLKLSKAEPGAQVQGKGAALEDQVAQEQQFTDAQARVKELEKNVSDLESLMAAKTAQNAPVSVPLALPKPPVVPAAPKPMPASAPPAPSLLDMALNNIVYVALGLGSLLLALLAWIAARRRSAKDVAPAAGTPPVEPAGPDVGNNSVFNSTFSASSSQLDIDEVDPVAEADVYIAYGREAQAEEILKEALRTHPERHPVRLKLLDIYAGRSDIESFQVQAGELHRLTEGSGSEWAQAAALGLTIDPLNPLYASAAVSTVAAPAAYLSKGELPAGAAGAAAVAAAVVPESREQTPAQTPDQTPAEFDLVPADDQGFEPETPPVAAPVSQAPAKPSNDIDFDRTFPLQPVPEFDFDAAIEPKVEVKPEPIPVPAALADTDFDFDLLPELAAEPEPKPEPKPAPESKIESEPALTLEPVLDLDLSEAEPVPAAAPDFDLSEITLDSDKAAAEVEPEAEPEPADAAVEEALSLQAVEMDTKLDLAVAYQEIGDKEGARELIDEVIKDGSKEQAAKARVMLAQLG